jgi:hypothetical protein
MKVLSAVLLTACTASFSPQRTAMRDRLFFGIEDAPATLGRARMSGPASAPVGLPPASSQLGVNPTATKDADLNDYGTGGPPPEVIAKREQAAVEAAAAKMSFFSFGSSPFKSGSQITARGVLDTISILWLVALIGGCYYFLRQAFEGANRKYRIGPMDSKFATKQKAVENMRIDREAYIYVADG